MPVPDHEAQRAGRRVNSVQYWGGATQWRLRRRKSKLVALHGSDSERQQQKAEWRMNRVDKSQIWKRGPASWR